jgi:intracellular multiplication protein IcmK
MEQRQEARPLREQQPGAANPNTGKTREAQALFEESLRQMMPLNEGQIQEYRERSDQRDRALLPVSPSLNSRTVRVTLEPGRAPVKVFTTANIATSLVFHDSTGQP